MKKTKLNNKGFSLIELMVVVAIIGILASVAVPNMQRFMAKSRQGEAKGLLGNLYSSLQNHHGEWSFYKGAFFDNGFAPEGEMRYFVGFAADGGPAALPGNYVENAEQCSNSGVAACRPRATIHPALTATGVAFANYAGGGGGCAAAAGANPNALYGNDSTFVATAMGEVGANGAAAATMDTWTMDQNRVVCNAIPMIE